jgi:hypothetical protein
MLAVWGQNKKLGWKKVLREVFPILLGYKPAVDAYRVASGAKQEVGLAVDPMLEMTCMKLSEMFAEAIPGVIIQLMAIATSDVDVPTAAWISLAVSALTTGFASASISYDYDTDPTKREKVPDFYGYIPAKASKRALVFVSMVFLTTGMLLIRCMTIVVLGQLGGNWVSLYIGSDLSLYLVVKILRGDFWWFLPLGGKAEIVSSICARILVKVVTDFTSIVQYRHPNDVGGVYWVFGVVLTMGSLPVAIFVGKSQLSDTTMTIACFVVGLFIPLTVICFGVFIYNIERKYLSTFFSTQRGKDYTMKNFRGGDDSTKAKYSFKMSKHHWISIEGEVRDWVKVNWQKWEDEEPEWFTDAMKARVPVEYIPTAGEAWRRESARRAIVDAEAEGGLGGALRASIRRASVGLGDDIHRARVVPIEEDN